jgi:phenylalanyl-tRNA synthetase alpha chain
VGGAAGSAGGAAGGVESDSFGSFDKSITCPFRVSLAEYPHFQLFETNGTRSDMAEVLEQIEVLTKEADQELAAVADLAALEQFRIKYLGSNGKVKNLMSLLKEVPKEQKPAFGQKSNAAKAQITEAFESKKQALSAAGVVPMTEDVTEPGKRPLVGNRHILMKVVDELTTLFGRMGFAVAAGPEVEDEFHNFIALNIPENHPARDPLDNFYLETKAGDPPLLLRTQTSTVQIRVMQTQKPPIRVVIPGKVYRPDTVDATHLFMFHQLEALVIDKNVTMVDLKSTIMQFVKAYFGPETKVRFRPSFFPFTEPSAEVDVWFEDKQRWIELGGCGMVHPNVLKQVNIDPEEYSGWAFGFGIERIAMRKYAIDDIRHLIENDIRFLKQF